MGHFRWIVVPALVAATVCASAADRRAAPLSTTEEQALKPQDSFKECDDCPEMMVVPGGSFVIGAPRTEPGYNSSVGSTQVPVSIARPFAVGRYSVSFDEWAACVLAGGCNGFRPGDNGWGRGRRPVINVNWHDAKAFVEWLSAKTGKRYRLPSEAEREYFTRGGTTTPFWWGSSISSEQANYDGRNSFVGGPISSFRRRTVAVDAFAPNPWGMYNVHGNVNEWVEDCWNASNLANPGDGSARSVTTCQRKSFNESEKAYEYALCERPDEPPGQTARGDVIISRCDRRTVRGGDWATSPSYLRSAHRSSLVPTLRIDNTGFRVAREFTAR